MPQPIPSHLVMPALYMTSRSKIKIFLKLLHQTITALKNDFYRTDDPQYVTIMLS